MTTIIRRSEVERRTGYSYETINRKEKRGEFPGRVRLGDRAVGWVEAEVDDWIKSRIRGIGPGLPARAEPAAAPAAS
jgi:prophage regulatory protein